ncbi:hypothetical protein G195_004563 [Phytophthora kernoviae 00238/432]|uniref:PDZ domain-containing protein n=1 Tax=Phytophthora kernoviae 00238/432 TaxID=1284355 RepID=A0A8J4SLF6_9STRA|nr:hypothetical protein G195_004563 [Phytophthora kernoviae 00238/432]
MAKAIISSILEGQLGKYVDGLRSDSLVVGLWSGELELRDLALKPHALAELQLPVAVASGSVSRVLVRVPWNQLGSASVTITLEGVSALVVPNTARPSNAELLQAKHNQLERRELLRQHRRFAAQVVPGDQTEKNQSAKVEDEGTFVSRLTARIVANLQVTLLDVHLRYEDAVANPEAPFACGVMLEKFRFFTTDGEGQEAFVDQTTVHDAFTYKKAELTQFGMYWDRLDAKDPNARLETLEEVPRLMRNMVQTVQVETDQGAETGRRWLLRPCSLGVQLTKNESTDYSTVAKYVVEANSEGGSWYSYFFGSDSSAPTSPAEEGEEPVLSAEGRENLREAYNDAVEKANSAHAVPIGKKQELPGTAIISHEGKEAEEAELMRSLERAQGRVEYDVLVDMDAPVLILPENVGDPTGAVLVVDLGMLSFRNEEEVTTIDTALDVALAASGEGCVELNLRESAAKDAFVVRASQTSFTLAAFSAHQEFQARLKALVMEDKLYSPGSRFNKLISTGEGVGDIPHLIAIDVTSFTPETESPDRQHFGGKASQLEADVHFNVLHLQWNPSSVALFYRIISAYAFAIQSHGDDFPPEDSTAARKLASGTAKHPEASRDEQNFSLTFNKDQLDRQLARLEMKDAALNFTSYDVEGRNSGDEDIFEVTGHVGNFVGTDLSTSKHPLYSMLIGLDEDEAHRRKDSGKKSEALLTFAFASDPMTSDKSSLRLAFQPVRGVYYHQQILELVDFLLEGVGGAMVSQTLMNATQLLLREDEASVVLDLTIEKPTLILPLSLEDSPHAKVTADVLRLDHFPASAAHYEGPPGARTKRVVHDEPLSRAMIRRTDAEGGGISLRVDCKDIFLEQVRIYCTVTGAGKKTRGDSERPLYEELLSDPANLKISIEDLVSSTVSLGDEEKIALILENFGADELQNAPAAGDMNKSNSVVRMKATQVGIAIPRDAYDPESPRVAFTGDFGLEFKWKPHPDAKKDNASGGDLEIQSSILADAQNMEVVLENAKRPGCCVASPSLNEQWDAIDVAPLIQLLEPCNLHVEVSDLFPHAGQRQQIVALSFTPIDVFVSYDDACMAMDTMQALDEAFAQHEGRHRATSLRYSPSVESAVPSALLRSRSSSKYIQEYDVAEEEEVHRYFTCELPSVSLTLINDCDGCDMGLAQLQVERCHLFLNVTYTIQQGDGDDLSASFATSDFPMPSRPMTTTISGGGNLVVLMSYYNPDTRDWHPMCAEWAIDASVQGSISHESELHVIVTASQPLDLTVTHGLLEVVASVGGAWKRRGALTTETKQEENKRLETAPCVIRNETGLPLGFWLSNGSFTTAPEVVSTGKLADLRYVHGLDRGRGVLLVEGCTSSSKWLELAPRGTPNGAVLSVQLTRIDDGRPFRLLLRVVGGTEHTARPVRVEIMAEIWVINRSGLDLVYGTAADSEAYIPPRAARAQVGNAQISAYSSDSGVSADYATRHFGSVTTLVSVIPRYLVLNHSRYTLLLLEAPDRQQQRLDASSNDNIAHHVLAAGDMYALYWVGGTRARLRASVLPDDDASDTFCSDGDSIPAAKSGAVGMEKYFLEITYLERPHAKYTWVERVHVELQNVKIATSMTFVDRLNKLQRETVAHFQHKSLVAAFPGEEVGDIDDNEEENLLAYFVDQKNDEEGIHSHDMSAMTGRKLYIASGEISPVRVVVSFTRDKSNSSHQGSDGFWLSNLKLKIENACVVLEGYRLSHALATQEALGGAIVRFYEQSVKSQALSLIESIEVTSLVTSMVTGGVTSLVSTLRGKPDPAAAAGATAPGMITSGGGDSSSDVAFRYEHMTNGEIIRKHSRAFGECHNSTEFLRQVRHLVYDWDANHTGLEARGCVALALINNSRHSLVVNTQLNDGASLRVLPLGRRHLASVLTDSGAASTGGGSTTSWRADRALVVFAYGYTPTLLTSGDVYFTVQSNACSIYATRKTARLRANRGYTATFTLQETQSWWSTNVVIIGDDLQANDSSAAPSDSDSLFGEAPGPDDQSADTSDGDDEFEVQFSGASLGIIAKQSGRSVIVRECVPSSAAQASGRIAAGDCILAVNGTRVDNTSQFKTLVSKAPRPIVLRFRATGRHSNAAYDLFGEHKPTGESPNLFG